MTRAVLALGSNLGDRLTYMRRAVSDLERVGSVEAVSSLYETEPVGGPMQGRFLNAAVVLETELSARKLLRAVLDVERDAGRVRDVRWGPRTLDIDIVAYGNEEIDDEKLTIPHPRAAERRFVLEPVAEIAPDVDVGGGLTARAALHQVVEGGTHRWRGDWRTEPPSLGTLGVVLVSLQFVLFIVFAVVSVVTADVTPEAWRLVLGIAIAGFGGLLVAGAFFVLGTQLSALPDPRPGGQLIQGNVFAIVRHPIYGGLLLGGVGSAITLASSWSLLPLAALAGLFRFKSEMEERALTLAHPEYSSYRIRVPRRFIPVVW
jgi:2-amino-4-hydroxy-6-hydroxymethyldihydropteridine diphosphokinase